MQAILSNEIQFQILFNPSNPPFYLTFYVLKYIIWLFGNSRKMVAPPYVAAHVAR